MEPLRIVALNASSCRVFIVIVYAKGLYICNNYILYELSKAVSSKLLSSGILVEEQRGFEPRGRFT
jgi:hypothetical protein